MVLPRVIDDLQEHPSLELGELAPQDRGDLLLGNAGGILHRPCLFLIGHDRVAVGTEPFLELLGAAPGGHDAFGPLGNPLLIPLLGLGDQQPPQRVWIGRGQRLRIPIQLVLGLHPSAEPLDRALRVLRHGHRCHINGEIDRVGDLTAAIRLPSMGHDLHDHALEVLDPGIVLGLELPGEPALGPAGKLLFAVVGHQELIERRQVSLLDALLRGGLQLGDNVVGGHIPQSGGLQSGAEEGLAPVGQTP